MYKCVRPVSLWTPSYLLLLWSPPLCLQQASGNKETSALWLHPEIPLWHSDSTNYLPPSTSVSPVWPVAGSLAVKGRSPCTRPPGGDGGMEKSITIHFYIQLKGDNAAVTADIFVNWRFNHTIHTNHITDQKSDKKRRNSWRRRSLLLDRSPVQGCLAGCAHSLLPLLPGSQRRSCWCLNTLMFQLPRWQCRLPSKKRNTHTQQADTH